MVVEEFGGFEGFEGSVGIEGIGALEEPGELVVDWAVMEEVVGVAVR